jgi:hypothetical protein
VKARRLRTLVVREVRATLRDPFMVITLVSVPLVALLAFSSILATNVEGMRLGVHDASRGALSRRLVADLAAGGAFEPRPYATREALEAALVAGEISAALVLPPDLQDVPAGRRRPRCRCYDEPNRARRQRGRIPALDPHREQRANPVRDCASARSRRSQVDVVTQALFNPQLRRAVHDRGHLRLRFVPHRVDPR